MNDVPKRGRPRKRTVEQVQKTQLNNARRLIQPTQIVSPLEINTILQNAQIREVSSIEFITDPNQQSVEWHHARVDRPWRKLVDLKTMKSWAEHDHWLERRKQYAEQMRARLLADVQNRQVKQRIAQLQDLEVVRASMLEYLQPLKDADGEIKRHPEKVGSGKSVKDNPLAGLPVFPLELGNIPQLLKRFIDLEQHMVDMRALVPDREENSTEVEKPITALLPPGTELSPEEIKVLAKVLLMQRQPGLADTPEIPVSITKEPKHG